MYHLQTSETLSSFSAPHPPISAWIMPHRHQQGTQSSFLPWHLWEPFRVRLQRPPISPSRPIKASNSKLCLEHRGGIAPSARRSEAELLRRATARNSCIQEGSVASSEHLCGGVQSAGHDHPRARKDTVIFFFYKNFKIQSDAWVRYTALSESLHIGRKGIF